MAALDLTAGLAHSDVALPLPLQAVALLLQEDVGQHRQGPEAHDGRRAHHLILIQAQLFLAITEQNLNGLITNDKFCMSRTARLQLSWWRLPRNARQTISTGVESPVTGNTEEYLSQQETHEETTMESSAVLRRTA